MTDHERRRLESLRALRLQWLMLLALGLVLGVLSYSVLHAQTPAPPAPRPAAPGPSATLPGEAPAALAVANAGPVRLREGTELTALSGHFERVGERFLFVAAAGTGRFTVLENLGLERALERAGERVSTTQWTIDATVTEFRGANYLLVRRATVAPRSAVDKTH